MTWDRLGYFYVSRRVGRRVVREYYGKGPIAEQAALLFARLRRRGPALGGVAKLSARVEQEHRARDASVDPCATPAAGAARPELSALAPDPGGAPEAEPGAPASSD